MSYIESTFDASTEDARSPRQRRLTRAQMADSFGVNHDIVIRNVSDKGVGATMQGAPPLKGSAVKFIIAHGMAMDGMIRWVQGRAFGIELDKPIDLQTLTEVIQRNQQSASQEGHWEVRRLHQVHSHHVDPNKLRKI